MRSISATRSARTAMGGARLRHNGYRRFITLLVIIVLKFVVYKCFGCHCFKICNPSNPYLWELVEEHLGDEEREARDGNGLRLTGKPSKFKRFTSGVLVSGVSKLCFSQQYFIFFTTRLSSIGTLGSLLRSISATRSAMPAMGGARIRLDWNHTKVEGVYKHFFVSNVSKLCFSQQLLKNCTTRLS